MAPTSALPGNELEHKLDFVDAVAESFLDEAQAHLGRSDLESALRSAHVAATVLIRQNRHLASPRLERLLQAVAARLDTVAAPSTPAPVECHGKPLCLHVLDEALLAGGVTAMATRWIDNDREQHVHCIAILEQQAPVPQRVTDIVASTGGRIWLPPGTGFVERALWLRALAANNADLIVLHVGVSDTVFGAALGKAGGAPMLHVNHTAHLFWAGSTIADRLAHCRGSALEELWAIRHRVGRAVTVPIPLPPPPARDSSSGGEGARIKQGLGLPAEAQVLLTVGAVFKYQRTEHLDFVAAIEGVLRDVPGAHLLAVGVVADERWRAASARVDGRIHALGPVSQAVIADLRSITEVYVEGFPFGTTTSLLEAGLRGIPVVLAPAESPPPYGSDGVSLDAVLTRPASVIAYQQEVMRLLGSAESRSRLGAELARSIAEHHTGRGWAAYLQRAIAVLPAVHAVAEPVEPAPTERAVYRHWTRFIDQSNSPYAESLEHAVVRAMALGLRPRFSQALRAACQRAQSFRDGHGIPAPVLAAALNGVLRVLPQRLATAAFRGLAFFYRSAVLARLRSRLSDLAQGRKAGAWYDAYRDIKR